MVTHYIKHLCIILFCKNLSIFSQQKLWCIKGIAEALGILGNTW